MTEALGAVFGGGLGGRIKGTFGDIDPLNKVPLKRARSRVQKGYPLRVSLILLPARLLLSKLTSRYWASPRQELLGGRLVLSLACSTVSRSKAEVPNHFPTSRFRV